MATQEEFDRLLEHLRGWKIRAITAEEHNQKLIVAMKAALAIIPSETMTAYKILDEALAQNESR